MTNKYIVIKPKICVCNGNYTSIKGSRVKVTYWKRIIYSILYFLRLNKSMGKACSTFTLLDI